MEEEAADAVAGLELLAAFLGRRLEDALLTREPGVAAPRLTLEPAVFAVSCLPLSHRLRVERAVPGRHAERGCPLEDRHLGGVLGDQREGLHGGRARADDSDSLPGEVDRLVRPETRVVGVARETIDSRYVRHPRNGEAARRHDHELGRENVVPIGRDLPAVTRLVERGARDPRAELDVTTEVEPVGDVVQVPEDLGLRRVALAPGPLLLELVGERIRVGHALDVAAGARVPVPVPGAADVVGGLDHPHREAELTQPVKHVEARRAGTDDDGVVRGRLRHLGRIVTLGARQEAPAARGSGVRDALRGEGGDRGRR